MRYVLHRSMNTISAVIPEGDTSSKQALTKVSPLRQVPQTSAGATLPKLFEKLSLANFSHFPLGCGDAAIALSRHNDTITVELLSPQGKLKSWELSADIQQPSGESFAMHNLKGDVVVSGSSLTLDIRFGSASGRFLRACQRRILDAIAPDTAHVRIAFEPKNDRVVIGLNQESPWAVNVSKENSRGQH